MLVTISVAGNGTAAVAMPGGTTLYHGGLVKEDISPSATRVLYSFNGQTVHYLHADHLGSVRSLTGDGGTIVSQQDGRPWGEVGGGNVPGST